MKNQDGLHSKNEPLFKPWRPYSVLDIMGPRIECDVCGNWQRLSALTETEAMRLAEQLGWRKIDGKDCCPKCQVADG